MSSILAIDPGCTESGWVTIDADTRRPLNHGKTPNGELRDLLANLWIIEVVAIEMIASYGMPVGREVFETCVWIGRFAEAARPVEAQLVTRKPVKMHHCGSNAAKDSHIAQALKDRFAPGAPNHGKGTKAAPGFFYGFKADVWQAFALAVYVADTTPAVGDGTPSTWQEWTPSTDVGNPVQEALDEVARRLSRAGHREVRRPANDGTMCMTCGFFWPCRPVAIVHEVRGSIVGDR